MTEQLEGQMSIFEVYGPDIWSGKTCQEHSVQTKEKTFKQSSRKSQGSSAQIVPMFLYLKRASGQSQDALWVTEMTDSRFLSHTDFTMRSFGECPSEERESRLSQILEEHPHPKYSLSPRACQGILNRAERRGKELPPVLREALIRQATPLKSGGGVDVDSHGKKAGKGPLVQTELSGTLGVSQDQTLITNANVNYEMQNKVYGISSYDSNAMKSPNPHSGIYEADTSRTLDLNGGSPACNQGGMAVVQGADLYNQTLTGQTAVSITAATGSSATHSGPSVVCLEGNGSRESHKGDGYIESDKMYTLNTIERHAVCVDQGAGKSSCQIEIEKSPTLATTHDGAPAVCHSYQEVTGSLCASGYDKLGVQEAANDMYVVQSCSWDGSQVSPTLTKNNAGGGQRMPDKDNFNAVVQSMEVFHCTSEEDKVQTLKARDYKDPQIVAYGVDCYNQTQTEEVSKALNSAATDSDHVPCVYGLDRASFNQGKNALYDFSVEEEKAQTLVSRGPGGVLTKQ